MAIKPHVVILGAGPAGLGAAYRLRSTDTADVTVLEQQSVVGGNAGSFTAGGQRLDFGSHRLHPTCDPQILADINALVGGDLLKRPRHGRIRLRGRWIHFPLKPVDLLLRLDPRFSLGTLRDMLVGAVRSKQLDGASFASVLMTSLGPTICENFYFPYARKIWGREPEEISPVQAQRRVSANSFIRLIRKVLSQVPGFGGGRSSGFFYYPRQGFGQISEAYAEASTARGANLLLECRVTAMERDDAANVWSVTAKSARKPGNETFTADYVWSTLPVSLLPRIMRSSAPRVVDAAASLKSRAMLLVYLQLAIDRFTEYDAHYFPGADVSITRLSEPKNYAAAKLPVGSTMLCGEIPCAVEDAIWQSSDGELARQVGEDLEKVGLGLPAPPAAFHVKRLPHAYPVYAKHFETHFQVLDEWVGSLPAFLSFGRQGLFAHDNTHHALAMAYAAAECLAGGTFDTARWKEFRKVFKGHTVED